MTRLIVMAAILAATSIAGFFRKRKRISAIEALLRQLRTLAVSPLTYRPIGGPEDDKTREALGRHDATVAQLQTLGATILGYAMEESHQKVPMRWFADSERTTFGYTGFVKSTVGTMQIAVLMSVSAERVVVTLCTPRPSPGLAQPPFVDRAVRVGPLQLVEAFAAHRQRRGDGMDRIETLDAAISAVEQLRARTATWRDSEPPADLLDRDLRAVLGRAYEQLGARLNRKLAVELPEARVRA